MSRTVATVELKGTQLKSGCPEHKFCAFTGKENDRCSVCHSAYIEDVCQHMTLPPGRTRPCFCDSCGELFSAISAFDMHQRPAGICRDPERRGLVLVEHGGWSMWAKPGTRPDDI